MLSKRRRSYYFAQPLSQAHHDRLIDGLPSLRTFLHLVQCSASLLLSQRFLRIPEISPDSVPPRGHLCILLVSQVFGWTIGLCGERDSIIGTKSRSLGIVS